MGEAGTITLILKWLPWIFTGATSVISKLIYDKYKDLKQTTLDNKSQLDEQAEDIHKLDLKITRIEGEKIGRPEFERVVGELKNEFKEEFNNFKREFKETSKENREYTERQFNALFKMIRENEERKKED